MLVYLHTYMLPHLLVRAHYTAHMSTQMLEHTLSYINAYTNAYINTFVHAYRYSILTCMHTYTHVCIHTCRQNITCIHTNMLWTTFSACLPDPKVQCTMLSFLAYTFQHHRLWFPAFSVLCVIVSLMFSSPACAFLPSTANIKAMHMQVTTNYTHLVQFTWLLNCLLCMSK